MRMFVSDSKPAISDQATPNLFLRLEHHGSTFHRAIHSFLLQMSGGYASGGWSASGILIM